MFDEDGFPGTMGEDGTFDGGDTAAIIGTMACLEPGVPADKRLLMYPHMMVRQLIYDEEKYPRRSPVRHPDPTKWYGQEDRFSRDQLIPLLCYMLSLVLYDKRLDVLFEMHKRNWFLFAWNTRKNGSFDAPEKPADITGPEIWALWIRIYKPIIGMLFLWVLDIETLVGSVIWRWFRKDRVTRNHMLVCITAYKSVPTITMRLAYHLNDWQDLIDRWDAHCQAVGEENTAALFRKAVYGKG